ncbi:cytochrome P450 4C1-like isoform X2 [Anoplolepis gracilipes]|uniref:cytochrome P450 4C1-like isoform X2 n=1 Tax=Anoplolepis gracilipes TaxID=354296 RepID=UPI003BA39BF2
MTFVSAALIILACIAISYFILNYRRQSSVKMINKMPGPKAFPLIGSALYFLQYSTDEFFKVLTKLAEDYSSPFKFWMGNKLFIGIYEPDQIKTILQSSVDKSIIYKMFEPVLGKGLITAPVSTWIKHRKVIRPSFNKSILQKYFDIFVEQSLILTDELRKIGLNGNKVILLEHISKYAVRAACGTMTDIKIEFPTNQINQCIEATKSFKKISRLRMRNVFLYPNFIFNLTALGQKQRQNNNFYHSFTDKLVQAQIYANEQNTKSKCETHRTLLDILIEVFHGDKFSQEIIHDNLVTIILAEKVYQELWEIYGTKTPKSAPIRYEDLPNMNYLDCVIKETMRIFPPVPCIGRHLTEDVKIGEFILPRDTEVLLGIITLHRNEKYWSNPLVFDPDRFLPEKEEIKSYSSYYMPFGVGSRNCIGMNYAMISLKVVLATLIRTFVFKVDKSIPIDKIKLNTDITLYSVEPLEVKIEKRDLH